MMMALIGQLWTSALYAWKREVFLPIWVEMCIAFPPHFLLPPY